MNENGVQVDANRVIDRLARRIAQLEVENAQLDALCQQMIAERTNGSTPDPAADAAALS